MNASSPLPLVKLAPDLWHAESFLRMPGGVQLPIRMTVLRKDDGSLLLHSPIQPREPLVQEIKALGPVSTLFSPNGFHYLFLQKWKDLFPAATTLAPELVRTKRPDFTIDQIIQKTPSPALGSTIQQVLIGGIPKIQEAVLYHVPTKTMIVSDLVFNIQNPRGGLGLFLHLFGTYKKPATSRLFRFFIDDKAAYNQSLEIMLSWDVERLIMTHGEVLEGAACRQVLETSLLKRSA